MKLSQRVALLFLLALPVFAQQYKVTQLGGLGGSFSAAFAINSHGQVAGEAEVPTGEVHTFLWTKGGGMQDLGTLGGDFASPIAINDSGQIAGLSRLLGSGVNRPYRWTQNGGMQDLGSILGGDSYSYRINAAGQIAGNSCSPNGTVCHGFFWSESSGMVDLGTLGGPNSLASGLNDLGQVVGRSDLANGSHHAFLWTRAAGMQDLGTIGNDSDSEAYALNNGAQIVGYSVLGQTWRAFRWTANEGMLDLGSLGGDFSYAQLIDDTDRIAGTSALPGRTLTHAFVWTSGTGIRDLGTPGNKTGSTLSLFLYKQGPIMARWEATRLLLWTPPSGRKQISGIEAFGFNQAGQIAGDKRHIATLLTPVMQVSLTSSKNPSRAGTAVKFTAKIKCVVGAPPDGEQVQFKDGGTVLGSGVLAGGVATFTTSGLSVGTHSITATYAGDENYDSRDAKVVSQVVNP